MKNKMNFISCCLLIINLVFLLINCFKNGYALKVIIVCSLMLILYIINLIALKKKSILIDNKKYNLIFLISNIIILLINLRDKFDVMIPCRDAWISMGPYTEFGLNGTTIFLDGNLIFMMVLLISVIAFAFINFKNSKVKE